MHREATQPDADVIEVEWLDDDIIDYEVVPAAAEPSVAGLVIVVVVVLCSLYANLSLLVTDPAYYRFFPPFREGYNSNHNKHLGAEYLSIAKALHSGRGYADPFRLETGPTAWMPPVLPVILAGLLWVCDGDEEAVTALFVLLQDLTLIGTGILVLALARCGAGFPARQGQTGMSAPRRLALVVFLSAIVYYFRLCFQFTHDCWIILAALDLVIAGMIWLRPLTASWRKTMGWGVFGGICAMISPVVGFTWGTLTLASGLRRRRRLAVALLMASITLTPWIVRNWLVFGRFIPVKSNLAYELYQSQCLQAGGVLRDGIWSTHPNSPNSSERWVYKRMGEMAFIEQKRDLFWKSVQADPVDFADRVANRFFAATLEYVSWSAREDARRPWALWIRRLTYPLPFLSLLFLLVTIPWRPLTTAQWVVIGVYFSYLMPYVLVSYYERYKFPLLAAEAALMVWAIDRMVRLLPWNRSEGVV